jgi:hypothetical protein
VPGNFHILARSKSHDLVPQMTNVSHEIHHLSIGEPLVYKMIDAQSVFVPNNVKDKLKPMDGNVYVTEGLHEAYHHYLKVVTTNVDGLGKRDENLKAYQILQNSQLAYYKSDVIPGTQLCELGAQLDAVELADCRLLLGSTIHLVDRGL